ncbi:ABC transporter permease [Piscinibacter sakaiensis]|uniref:ABC transporter permease n=1 Tax=Piscinibacter sakaiensis TaxID=1547922 RepID=UPI003AAE95B4
MTTPLGRSFAIQSRVIHALLMREVITRYGRHNIGFLWLFVEPMLFTLGVSLIWSAMRALHGSNIPIVAFALTGYSTLILWRNMPGRCIGAIQPNQSLLYHRHVKPVDIYLSRLILELAGATASFLFLAVLFIAFELMAPPEDVLKVVFGWAMIAWFGFATGMLVGGLSERSDLVDRLWHPLTYFMLPFSGVFSLVDALPPIGRDLVLALPMAHGVELIRDGFFGSAVTTHYNLPYMAAFCLVLSLLGLAEVRGVGRRLTPG